MSLVIISNCSQEPCLNTLVTSQDLKPCTVGWEHQLTNQLMLSTLSGSLTVPLVSWPLVEKVTAVKWCSPVVRRLLQWCHLMACQCCSPRRWLADDCQSKRTLIASSCTNETAEWSGIRETTDSLHLCTYTVWKRLRPWSDSRCSSQGTLWMCCCSFSFIFPCLLFF